MKGNFLSAIRTVGEVAGKFRYLNEYLRDDARMSALRGVLEKLAHEIRKRQIGDTECPTTIREWQPPMDIIAVFAAFSPEKKEDE